MDNCRKQYISGKPTDGKIRYRNVKYMQAYFQDIINIDMYIERGGISFLGMGNDHTVKMCIDTI